MKKKMKELSVFFPTYNEEENIEKTVAEAKKVLLAVAKTWEIIIVEDGSRDKTPEVADRIARLDKQSLRAGAQKRIRVIHHKPNRGYGGALKTGYGAAKYEWVAFTDSDGQFRFSEIEKFIKLTNKADLILGYRISRKDPMIRKIYTLVWSRMLPMILFGLNVRDYSCGFWMIKKQVYNKIKPIESEEKVTKIEMLVKAKRRGFKFAQVGVNHYPREYGKQTGADLKVVKKSLVDLFELWKRLR